MKVSIEDQNETRKVMRVSYTADETAAQEKKVLREVSKQAKIPGFRPGKAPDSLIRQKFGAQVKERLTQGLTGQAYEAAVKEAGKPIVNLIEYTGHEAIAGGAEGELIFTVDVEPEFDLPEYQGIAVTVPSTEVAEQEVDQALDSIRRQRANFEKVEREAQVGDYVQVSYEGRIGEEKIAELVADQPIWGEQKNTWEEAGANTDEHPGVPAVVAGVVGMKAGEEKESEMTFPEDHPVEALRGKHAVYHIEVHEVRERVLPEINEDFLKSLQVESEFELKERIKEDIGRQKEQQAEQQKRQQISEALLERVEFPLPESAVDSETERLVRQIMEQNLQRGVTQEQLEANSESLMQEGRRQAAARVKRGYLLRAIAEKESIEVGEEDFQRAIMAQAMQTRQRPEEIVKELQGDRGRIEALRKHLLEDKALAFLADKATVSVSG